MAMDLNAKAAYIRGLMTGMEFDPNSKNGKIIAAMMDLLEEMAATVTEHSPTPSSAPKKTTRTRMPSTKSPAPTAAP